MKKLVPFSLLLLSTGAFADGVSPRTNWSFKEMAQIPIQVGGRLKPLDTFAAETVLFETGSRTFKGFDPVELVLSWLVFPDRWQDEPIFQVNHLAAKRQLGLEGDRKHFSYTELLAKSHLQQYLPGLTNPMGANQSAPISKVSKTDARETELKNLLSRMGLFQTIVSGQAWTVIPSARESGWLSLAEGVHRASDGNRAFGDMVLAYKAGDQAVFEEKAKIARQKLSAEITDWNSTRAQRIEIEYRFNHLHPFQWAWIGYLIGALLFLLQKNSYAWTFTGVGFVFHLLGFGLRIFISERPPVTNMYESVVWVAFGILLFGSILYQRLRQNILMIVSCVLAGISLIIVNLAPAVMDPSIQPLVPVLRSNFWLTIHVLTITLGYAAFALTLGIGNVAVFQFTKPGRTKRIAELNHMSYRAMQFGVVLLAAGTILGGVWADYSWGRFWGWDPKEVWALIALLGYLALLHSRYTGWIGQFGFAIITVLCFLGVLMAWYGVNFVLGVGLHSYGFSTGGRGTVAFFVILQLAYLTVISVLYKRRAPVTAPAS